MKFEQGKDSVWFNTAPNHPVLSQFQFHSQVKVGTWMLSRARETWKYDPEVIGDPIVDQTLASLRFLYREQQVFVLYDRGYSVVYITDEHGTSTPIMVAFTHHADRAVLQKTLNNISETPRLSKL